MKIVIDMRDASFWYDVHSLVKSFYPGADVMRTDDASDASCADGGAGSASGSTDKAGASPDGTVLRFGIDIGKEAVRLTGGGGNVLSEGEIPPGTARPEVKNVLKRTLYRGLRKETGKELPWGTLSGIRPVKIPMKMLRQGKGREEILRYLSETYYTSSDRASLALGIAERELRVISGAEALSSGKRVSGGMEGLLSGYSLYISVPFCPGICLYCTFPSGPVAKYLGDLDAYFASLESELFEIRRLTEGRTPESIYIGGGTPTSLPDRYFEKLLALTEQYFNTAETLEYTVEAGRPDTLNAYRFAEMKKRGVSRISINPQTMNDKTLRLVGRNHTAEDIRRAFSEARDMGFTDINMDLITGLPGETAEDMKHTFDEIVRLGPEALTVHSLAVKRSSRLKAEMERYRSLGSENSRDIMAAAREAAESMGMTPYYLYRQKNMTGNLENVGFAKEGYAGLYNILIMEELQTILAAGPGAISKVVYGGGEKIVRAANVSSIPDYLGRTEEMNARRAQAWAARFE